MRSRANIFPSFRFCGLLFVFLATFLLILSWVHFVTGRWELGLLLFALGVVIFGSIAWFVVANTIRSSHVSSERGPDGGGAGLSSAGKPVPVRPVPTHHLAAAKDLPPLEETHSLPHD